MRTIISIAMLLMLSGAATAADQHTDAVLTPMQPGETIIRPAPMKKHLQWHLALNAFQQSFEARVAAAQLDQPDPFVTGSITRPE